MKYIPFIGLEIHIEPNTGTKMFCGCPQDHFGKEPNSQTCPMCLGLPGALPYANFEAIKKTVLLGLALGSEISRFSNFYRKHYFYPDLPKSFQTSQKDYPLCVGGELIGKEIDHIHLEEDAGKLIHQVVDGKRVSLVDFNRSGCALIELVTKPVFHSSKEVLEFTKELQLVIRYLDVSGADMEKGTMRLEANISVSRVPDKLPDYKVELKNINSFRFLVNAIEAEISRQTTALGNGEKLIQETRGYDEVKKTTFSQRSKEEAQDYRYFPEADLPPVKLSEADIEAIKAKVPELPQEKRTRFAEKYVLPGNYIDYLIQSKDKAVFYEKVFSIAEKEKIEPRLIANLVVNKGLDAETPDKLIDSAKSSISVTFSTEEDVEKAVTEVVSSQTKAVQDFKNGKLQVLGFLLGQVQKILGGKGDPRQIQKELGKKLK